MYNPLITIVIASYNSGKTIKRALQSVADQSFQDWECLIVDGASKDDTIDIVKEFAEKDSRFRYISEPDKGIYDAFNKGLKNARGEWMYYLGSDDLLTVDGLTNLSKECNNTDVMTFCGDVYVCNFDGHKSIIKGQDGKKGLGIHQGMLMRKEAVETMGGFDMSYKILADYDLMARLLNNDYKFKVVDCPPIAYFTQGGMSSKFSSLIQWAKERYFINKKNKNIKWPLLDCLDILYHKLRSNTYRKLRQITNY